MAKMALTFMLFFCVSLIVADMVTALIPMSTGARRVISLAAILMMGWMFKNYFEPRDPDGDAH